VVAIFGAVVAMNAMRGKGRKVALRTKEEIQRCLDQTTEKRSWFYQQCIDLAQLLLLSRMEEHRPDPNPTLATTLIAIDLADTPPERSIKAEPPSSPPLSPPSSSRHAPQEERGTKRKLRRILPEEQEDDLPKIKEETTEEEEEESRDVKRVLKRFKEEGQS